MTSAHARPTTPRLALLAPALLFLLFAPACGRYYRVTDSTTEKIYYTADLTKEKHFNLNPDPAKRYGVVHFTDARTKCNVTLHSAQVEHISEQQFNYAIEGE